MTQKPRRSRPRGYSIPGRFGLPETGEGWTGCPNRLVLIAKELKLPPEQFVALFGLLMLWRPENGNTLDASVRDVAENIPLTKSATQRALAALADAGLITRLPKDDRSIVTDLTPLLALIRQNHALQKTAAPTDPRRGLSVVPPVGQDNPLKLSHARDRGVPREHQRCPTREPGAAHQEQEKDIRGVRATTGDEPVARTLLPGTAQENGSATAASAPATPEDRATFIARQQRIAAEWAADERAKQKPPAAEA